MVFLLEHHADYSQFEADVYALLVLHCVRTAGLATTPCRASRSRSPDMTREAQAWKRREFRIEDALVLSQEIAKLNLAPDAIPDGTPRRNLPLALQNYEKNRVLRAAAVQGLSRVSSAFLFQYQVKWPPDCV